MASPTLTRVERYLEYREPDGVSTLFRLAVDRARTDAERAERDEVARRVRDAIARLVGNEAAADRRANRADEGNRTPVFSLGS